jgi:hypothetical protein
MTCFMPSFHPGEQSILDLKDGTNSIELDVTNLWPNRIIGDAQPSTSDAYTKTNISKYTSDSPLLPSGLVGPVTIETIHAASMQTPKPAGEKH